MLTVVFQSYKCSSSWRTQGSKHPGWLVIWGPYSREFWAFAYLHVPSGTLIHAPDPETLLTGILEKETQASRKR